MPKRWRETSWAASVQCPYVRQSEISQLYATSTGPRQRVPHGARVKNKQRNEINNAEALTIKPSPKKQEKNTKIYNKIYIVAKFVNQIESNEK